MCVNVPNFIKSGQTVAEIRRLNGFFFKMAAIRHLGFLKFKFLTVEAVKNLFYIQLYFSVVYNGGKWHCSVGKQVSTDRKALSVCDDRAGTGAPRHCSAICCHCIRGAPL